MCLTEEVVYRCDVKTDCDADNRYYIGSCSTSFKSRFYNHCKSFTHERYAKETTLSGYLWQLKNAEKNYSLKWSIVAKAKPYHPLAGRCRLCTREKTEISAHIEDPKCLNVRGELMSTCRHRRRWLLSSTPGWLFNHYHLSYILYLMCLYCKSATLPCKNAQCCRSYFSIHST